MNLTKKHTEYINWVTELKPRWCELVARTVADRNVRTTQLILLLFIVLLQRGCIYEEHL